MAKRNEGNTATVNPELSVRLWRASGYVIDTVR